ncbi:PTS transporter subunit EIIC [Fodinisporobacter ferrooxydans]|uniref:PTS transporter subunit EIIC n=1 Tax=Fodinisporobacter ferrooxydans TaxID=2901836 RepID=A0ABY4CG96_9BACL|nr:PTS transporter subunit EIIC [Alicyclobacillaceae bacterium MYW30-H2]
MMEQVEKKVEQASQKQTVTQHVFKFISSSFGPLIPVFAGSATIKALLALLTMLHWLSPGSGTYLILAAAGNSVFFFMPILLGITGSMALGANPYIGGAIGAALMEPNFTGLLHHGSVSSFLGIPVVLANYASTIFPIFFAIPIYAVLEKFLKKIIHRDIQLFMVPMLSLIIIVPLTAMVVGPFGTYAGQLVSTIVLFLFSKSGLLAGAVLGAAWTFLTVIGLHMALVPVAITDISHGGDPLMATASAGVFAQIGFALGMLIRTRDVGLRSLAGASLIPGILSGETRPILYGLFLPYRRTFVFVVIAGAAGGAISGAAGVKMTALAFPSFLSIPLFAPMVPYVIGMLVAFLAAMVLTILFGYEKTGKTRESSGK